jgi:hypothetical protein
MNAFRYALLLTPQLPQEFLRFVAPNLFLKDGDKYLLSSHLQYDPPFLKLKLIFVDENNRTELPFWLPPQLVLSAAEVADAPGGKLGFVPAGNKDS